MDYAAGSNRLRALWYFRVPDAEGRAAEVLERPLIAPEGLLLRRPVAGSGSVSSVSVCW